MSAPEEKAKSASHDELHMAVGKLEDEVLEGRHEPPNADPTRMTEADWREVYLSIGKLVPKKS